VKGKKEPDRGKEIQFAIHKKLACWKR